MKSIYLTIDDTPSIHTKQIVDFLTKYQIPAAFFCRGEFIEKYPKAVSYIIQHGFLVGNHSYSHPYFSHLSLEKCLEEIQKTEDLIDACYHQAQIKRPCKIVRLPFGDLGSLENAPLIEGFLQQQNFLPLDFETVRSQNIFSAPWTWDTKDYKQAFIHDKTSYEQSLEQYYQHSKLDKEILLIHDFEHNFHLFETTMKFLITKRVQFLPIRTMASKSTAVDFGDHFKLGLQHEAFLESCLDNVSET